MERKRWQEIKNNLVQLDEEFGSDCPEHSLTCATTIFELLAEIEMSLYLTNNEEGKEKNEESCDYNRNRRSFKR